MDFTLPETGCNDASQSIDLDASVVGNAQLGAAGRNELRFFSVVSEKDRHDVEMAEAEAERAAERARLLDQPEPKHMEEAAILFDAVAEFPWLSHQRCSQCCSIDLNSLHSSCWTPRL